MSDLINPAPYWSTIQLQEHVVWYWWEGIVLKYLLAGFLLTGTAAFSYVVYTWLRDEWRKRKN